MMQTWYLTMFLVFLAVAGLIAGAILLINGLRRQPQVAGDALRRDRDHLQRLEAIDQRLERLEKTLHDLPS